MSRPAHDVLADLLLAALEAGRLEETTDLLSDLVGERPVREALEVVHLRLSRAVAAAAGVPRRPGAAAGASGDVFDLTRRLRASTPGGLP